MAFRDHSSLFRAALALAFLLVLAACTPGGQFDPTEMFNSDMFDSKTKLKGQREPLFPSGVPGTTTGVPADLVKGYQPPPDQASADPDSINAPAPNQAAQPQVKPKPKPTPKVAVGHPQTRSAKIEKPPSSSPTRIDIGAKGAPPQQPSGAPWPNSPPAAQQGGQFVWPSPAQNAPAQQAAQPSQSVWPAPPSTAPAQPAPASSAAPSSQSGQSFDSMWPKPTAGSAPTQ
jgi:hypothetical protein